MLRIKVIEEGGKMSLPNDVTEEDFLKVAEILGHTMPPDQRILIGWLMREDAREVVLMFVTEVVSKAGFDWPMQFVEGPLRVEAFELAINPEFLRKAMMDFAPDAWKSAEK